MNSASSIVLAPLSVLYAAVTRTRLALYKRGVLKLSTLDAPVISVGNITTGGTGKTPLVEWVARALDRQGRKVCILTRGYGRENPNIRIVVSDGQRILANELEAGDEPRLLAENLLGLAAVISDADRFAAGQWANKEFGSDVFILDDGFQHLRLVRDLNIVTIDATNPWGGGRLLPYGRLREPRGVLSRADCVVITRADQAHDLVRPGSALSAARSVGRPVSSARHLLRRAAERPRAGEGDLGAVRGVGRCRATGVDRVREIPVEADDVPADGQPGHGSVAMAKRMPRRRSTHRT